MFDPDRAFTPYCEAHYVAESSFIEIDSTVCYVNIVAALGRARGETLDLYESPDDEEPLRRWPGFVRKLESEVRIRHETHGRKSEYSARELKALMKDLRAFGVFFRNSQQERNVSHSGSAAHTP